MAVVLNQKIQLKRGTAVALFNLDPTPEAGEIIVELDTGKFKIGDGLRSWVDLPYSNTANNLEIGTIAGLQQALDGKQPAGSYVLTTDARLSDERLPLAHTHTVNQITDLQTALDAKQAAGSYVTTTDARLSDSRTPLAHTHTASQIVDLQAALDAKQPVGAYVTTTDARLSDARTPLAHAHTVVDILNLQTLLAGKQATGDYVVTSDSRLSDARTPTTHTHVIADVAGLNDALASKPTLVGGVIPLTQLPVDQFPVPAVPSDVIEAIEFANLPATGAAGKLYVTKDNNKLYYWGGSSYLEITATVNVSSTDSVAEGSTNLYFTDARAAAAAPVQSVAGQTGIITLTRDDVGLYNVDDTADINKPISTATQNALDAKAAVTHTHTLSSITDVGTAASKNIPDSGNASAIEVVLGSDTRLSNRRPPTAHQSTHAIGGGDELTPADIGAAESAHTHVSGDITGLGTAAVSNIPATGNAATNEVVIGTDTRLTDSRTPTSHASTHAIGGSDAITLVAAQISDFDIAATAAVAASAGTAPTNASLLTTGTLADARLSANVVLTGDSRLTNSRAPTAHQSTHAIGGADPITPAAIGAAASSHTHAIGDITGVGTAAIRNIPATGNAANNEIVIGTDTRLTNARTPTSHSSTHASGGADPITPAAIGAAPSSHTHALGDITGVGTAAVRNIPTTGDAATNEIVIGTDTRLTNSRAPTSHASSHASGGADPITPASIGAAASSHTHSASQVTGLANVATSGSYLDLADTPAAYSLPVATSGVLGGVKVGSGIALAGDGTISVVSSGGGGTLDIASATTLGGIKIGSGVSIDASGVLSVTSTSGGTVSQISVATANGISGTVANATTTPVITLSLGSITPATVSTSTLVVGGMLYPTTKGTNGQVLVTNGTTRVNWTSLATVASTGSYNDLSNKPTIPSAQVNSDWSSSSGVSQILNKPLLATVATSGAYTDLSDLPLLATVATTGAYADLTGQPALTTVATTGSYTDLINKPTIPAEQVNSDWTATTGLAQILNKPTLATVATSGSYADLTNKPALTTVATSGLYADLSGKPTIPAAQVNSDWTATTGLAQILNKPTFSTVATSGSYADLTNKPALTTVATTGSYTDLINKPTIPAAPVNADWTATTGLAQVLNKPTLATVATSGVYTDLTGRPTLATVATSGAYNDLSGKPTIPAAPVNADWTAITGLAQVLNKPTFAAVATSGSYTDLINRPALATVATSGSYADLSSKPTIPAAQVSADWTAVSGVSQIINKPTFATVATSGAYTDLTGRPTFAVVATTGSYNDLSSRPTIPAASTVSPLDGVSAAAVGTSTAYARADHQHKLPTAAAIGAAASSHQHAISDVTNLQTALDGKQATGTYATLVSGTVPSAQLPNYVYAALINFPTSGEAGRFYTASTTGKVYRWTGLSYAEWLPGVATTDSLTEGTTNRYFTTARAASAAPVQSVAGKTGVVALAKADVGLGNVDNTTDVSKPISTATQTALDTKSPIASPTFTGTPAAPTPAADTNTTQLATAAFVLGQAASVAPSAPGTAAVGTSLKYARADHTHAAQTITLTGDVTGAGTGSFASTISAGAVTYAKIQNVSATDRLLGRATAGAGVIEEITCTAFGRSLISSASAAATRTTLGLAAVASTGSFTDLINVPAAQDALARTGGTLSGSLIVTGTLGVGAAATNKFDVIGGRSTFAANSEQYAIGAKFSSVGGAVYFGATNATSTPDASICNAGGSQLMVLQNGGNVGIGVATPAAKLDVAGNVNVNASTGTALTVTNTGTGNSLVVNDVISDTTPFVVTATGMVGIGTASPVAELDLQGTGNVEMRVYDTGGGIAQLQLKSGTNDGQVAQNGNTLSMTNYAAAGGMAFSQAGAGAITFTVNSLQGLRIGSDANVAIGNSAAVNTLRYFDINNLDNGAAAGSCLRFVTRNTADTAATTVDVVKYKNGAFVINNNEPSTSATMQFGVAGATRMLITSTGSVGIGDTTPNAKLHVADSSANPMLIVDALGTQDNAIWFSRNGAARWYVYNDNATNGFIIGNTTANPALKIDASGNVGIGTDTPTQKLHVVGNISATMSYTAFDSSARSYSREWIEFPNFTGLRSANNAALLSPNNGTYGAWKVSGSRNNWAGLEFSDSGTSLMQAPGGDTTGFHRNGYGWQFYWQTGELRCFKNQYGGGTNAAVLDSVNYSNYISESNKNVMHGRLGLVAGNPYSYADVAASAALYYSPYLGNNLSLYDTGTNTWKAYSFSEISIANTGLVASTNYDVFVFNNAGTMTLELVAWASTSARVTELTLLSGVYVKTGAYNRRYIGTIRTNASAQFADHQAQRFIWNMYNKRPTRMYLEDAVANTYSSGGAIIARAWRNAPATFVTEAVFGLETPIHAALTSSATPTVGAVFTHINEDLADTSITFQGTVHTFMSTTTSDRSSSVEFAGARARGSHKYYPMQRLNVSSSASFNNFMMSISFEA